MKKIWIMLLGAGLVTIGACTRTETADETAETTTETTTTTTTETVGNMDNDSMYRQRADRYASQLSTDLNLDTTQQRKASTTYYNRTRRYGDLETRYSTDTTGMYQERTTIDRETDAELRSYLTPEQWTQYETNRMNYADTEFKMKTDDMKMKVEGDESKFKSGDTKMKTEGDETKMESGDTKMKTDGDESKYKSGDTKVKSETGESKYKSGDTKIKVETK